MSTNEMRRSCACFTTDLGYAFPTLLSAIQARRHLQAGQTDVIIVLFDNDESAGGIFAEICQEKGIQLITAHLSILQGYTPMYARLFLNDLLPGCYERILYVDGDTQIRGSLDVLMQSQLADNTFLAVADPMAILADTAGPAATALSSYFAGLGVKNSPTTPYFNSGVLLINRGSWSGISAAALSFLAERPDLCLFQDQSALNHAGQKHLVPLSFQWNFPIFFRNCGVESAIQPRIYHFMSKPKPWNTVLPPWNASFSEPYDSLKREFPSLCKYAPPLPMKTYFRYLGQQNWKRIREGFSWRLSNRRRAIIRFNEAAKL